MSKSITSSAVSQVGASQLSESLKASLNELHWSQRAIIYELAVISFKDSNGDGKGDLKGLLDKLDYLEGPINLVHEPRRFDWPDDGRLALTTHLDRHCLAVYGPLLLRADEGVIIEIQE